MGRAIIRSPKVYLMDEPLSNLDAKLRVQMRADIAELQGDLGVTTVYVTHDQAEAMTLGHRVAVLRDGRLQQCAAPRVLYDTPVNAFVAGFIGSPSMCFADAPVGSNGSLDLAGVKLELNEASLGAIRGRGLDRVTVGIRPESLTLGSSGVPARVEAVEVLGADAYAYCSAEVSGASTRLTARVDVSSLPDRGEAVSLAVVPRAESIHLFDATTGERLPS
jgi:multiple sugar transport system ATP-binding protein